MLVKNIKCNNFKNLENLSLAPCEEMNVIYGENAQGKTNIIEAIWLFSGAKSFRNSKENTFLMKGKEKGSNEILFDSRGVEYSAKIEFSEKRTAFLNEKALFSPSKLAGNFKAVVFSPADLSLVCDGPNVRRNFLDLSIGQIYPSYITILKSYIKAVTQRNQIIKEYKYDGSVSIMLDIFEKEIALMGKKIIEYRKGHLEKIKEFLPGIYDGLSSGKEKIDAKYICNCEADSLRENLIVSRKQDMLSAVTSVGPHRDDVLISVNSMNVRSFGSQGQKRSVALSMKLAEAETIKEITGENPVCLLDDVMSELDPARQNYILNHIKGRQSFLTCCDPSNIKNLKEGKKFEIKEGKIIGS